jgi:NAD(P)-dependent dehydrogenase (short-subunit alcohol dehydrogenase family)
MGELKNKVAVIDGAGGDIGGAVARTFAREVVFSGPSPKKTTALKATAASSRSGACRCHRSVWDLR